MNRYLLLLAGLFVFFSACKSDDPEPTPVAGKGGNAVLNVTPAHHGKPIDSCIIYIKYNAVDAPADGRYDDSAACVPVGGLPVATFSGLKKGNYYVLGRGWDPKWTPPSPVQGAFAYPLTTENTQTLELAVSE